MFHRRKDPKDSSIELHRDDTSTSSNASYKTKDDLTQFHHSGDHMLPTCEHGITDSAAGSSLVDAQEIVDNTEGRRINASALVLGVLLAGASAVELGKTASDTTHLDYEKLAILITLFVGPVVYLGSEFIKKIKDIKDKI